MPIEFCHLCRTAANMVVSSTPRTIASKAGKMKTIITKTYHCESCGSFVRSVDDDENAAAA
ncbi:MAG: hypothetical protein M0R70_15035 [Nitrospirae bacterium]|nr:hypothetical protein [Nitrospirota bacterium]